MYYQLKFVLHHMNLTSGPQTTARGPDSARLHIWTGPLNNIRRVPIYYFFHLTRCR